LITFLAIIIILENSIFYREHLLIFKHIIAWFFFVSPRGA